jgi:hypothetical protein
MSTVENALVIVEVFLVPTVAKIITVEAVVVVKV